jgi:pimeloyl-ACP methyl ester carboxylesterase
MVLPDAKGVKLDGGSISGVIRKGPGVPVLLVHGNSSCKEAFADLWKVLIGLDREVLAIDLPGHGASRDALDPHATYTFPGYARVVSGVMDEVGWRRAIAIGWSLGGHIVLQTMIDDPRIESGLVIGTPPGKPSIGAFEAAFNSDATTLLAGTEVFSGEDALRYTRAMLGVQDPDPDLIAAAQRADGRARSRMIQSVVEGLGADQCDAYANATGRVAVVVGENDPFLRMSYLDSLDTSRLWRGKVHRLPNVGHAPHYAPSPDFIQLVKSFLAERSAVI